MNAFRDATFAKVATVAGLAAGVVALAAGCASDGAAMRDAPPRQIADVLERTEAQSDPQSVSESANESANGSVDGTMEGYVAIALDQQPSLAGHADRWRAASYEADAAAAWPRLTLTYAFLPLPVETRLGPQRHRVSVRQGIPWPGLTAAASDAAAARADVETAGLDATADQIVRDVGIAYWDLWEARQRGVILSDQLTVLETSARIARGGVEVGKQGLSSISRIELAASRLRDTQAANSARIAAAEARLRGALAVDPGPIPTTPPPFEADPLGDDASDVADAPAINMMRRKVDAATRAAEAADLSARPSFSVGVDWILVGEGSAMADDAGRDAVMLMVGISLPTTWSAEASRGEAASMRASAMTHEVDASLIDRRAMAETELLMARDAARRTTFYSTTLLPQAETAFEAALGDYESGRVGVADLLLAQREWLDLANGEVAARANYERALVRLRALNGRIRPTAPGGQRD